jgi:micrococcal nuclease
MGQCFSVAIELLATLSAAQSQNENDQQQQQQNQQQTPTTPTTGSVSPIYSSLPAGAEQHRVRNVYDGDTLTLTDERRVRFLGIDTPEIKEKQPFAQEAKAYTKSLCDKKDIWLSFEPNLDKEDHYGRLLAFVWVPAETGNGYLSVNEGIVAAGLASAYIPNQQSKLHNWDKLIKLQSDARSNKRGMWSSFQNDTVYKTANGSAFHRKDCKHLQNIKNLTELQRSDAMERGLHACRTCLAD